MSEKHFKGQVRILGEILSNHFLQMSVNITAAQK